MATWRYGTHGGLYLQNQKIGVYNHKTFIRNNLYCQSQDKASNPYIRRCVRSVTPPLEIKLPFMRLLNKKYH